MQATHLNSELLDNVLATGRFIKCLIEKEVVLLPQSLSATCVLQSIQPFYSGNMCTNSNNNGNNNNNNTNDNTHICNINQSNPSIITKVVDCQACPLHSA